MDSINRNNISEFDEGKLNAVIAGMDAFLAPLDRTVIRVVAEHPGISVDSLVIAVTNEGRASNDDVLARLRELTNAKDGGSRAAYIRCGLHNNCVGNQYQCTLVLSELGQAMINSWEDMGEGAPEGFLKFVPDVPDEPLPNQPRPTEMEW